MSALVLDLDHLADEALEDALSRLEPYEYVMHSSHSDRPGSRCVRVVLLLSRPVAGVDWERFWMTATAQLGVPADQHCKDASRLYFLPTRPGDAWKEADDGSGYDYAAHDGASLDVDAILALAPPVKPHEAHEAPAGAEYREPTAEARATAVRLLGEVWPESGKRHEAYLALAGGLIRAGWSIDQVAQFSFDVVSIKTPDYDDFSKRLADARTSYNRIAAGEPATGWPRLVGCLAQSDVTADAAEKAVDAAMGALDMGVPDDDPEFLAVMTEAARRRAKWTLVTPTFLEVKTTLEKARDRLKKSKDPTKAVLGEILAKVLSGKFLSDRGKDRERELAMAALAVVRHAPAGTRREDMHEFLQGPACELADEVPAIVEAAIEHVAREAREAEPSEKDARDLPEPPNDEELRANLTRTKQGEIKSNAVNIAYILRYASDLRGHLRFNDLTKEIEITGGRFQTELPDGLFLGISIWLSSHWDLNLPADCVGDHVLRIARTWYSYSPAADYLNSLKWDGIPRLDRWLVTYFGAEDSKHVREVGSRWLISCAARALSPGCQADSMLVLEGAQGAGKSTGIRILAGSWYSGSQTKMGEKDALLMNTCNWIIEFQELASLSQKDSESIKAFMTVQVDQFRPPYGRVMQRFSRRCVFAGTTNNKEYLKDPTGHRRFWTVHVEQLDEVALKDDRGQLWAEAVARYKSAAMNPHLAHRDCPGERWWFTKVEQPELDKVAQERMVENPVADEIRAFVEMEVRRKPGKLFTFAEIVKSVLQIPALEANKRTAEIAAAMRLAGLERVPGRPGTGSRQRLWQYTQAMESGGLTTASGVPPVAPAPPNARIVN